MDEMEYEEDVADDDDGQRHDEMEEDEEEKQTQVGPLATVRGLSPDIHS